MNIYACSLSLLNSFSLTNSPCHKKLVGYFHEKRRESKIKSKPLKKLKIVSAYVDLKP
jgi:hypothetical protein